MCISVTLADTRKEAVLSTQCLDLAYGIGYMISFAPIIRYRVHDKFAPSIRYRLHDKFAPGRASVIFEAKDTSI
jgi:hypothetical protein